MANGFDIEADKQYVADIEEFTRTELRAALGREPSRSEVQIEAQIFAAQEDRNYAAIKQRVNAAPGPVRQAIGDFTGAVGSGLADVGAAALNTITDRTASLRSEDSSLPSVEIPFSPAGRFIQETGNLIDPGTPLFRDADTGRALPGAEDVVIPEIPGTVTVGAEEVADAIELGGPLAAEFAILRGQNTVPGFVLKTMAANVGSEVTAEFIRAIDRRAAQLPNSAVNLRDPADTAQHFLNVAAGGALLGGADLLINSAELRAQRRAYKAAFGLGTPASQEKIDRMLRLGVNPSLAQAADGFITAVTASLAVYPITSRRELKRARKTVEKLSRNFGDTIGNLADHASSGVFLHDKSRRWFRVNDEYISRTRERAGRVYDNARALTEAAEKQFGRQAVHVPHDGVRDDIENVVIEKAIGVPLEREAGRFNFQRVPETELTQDPGWDVLQSVLNLEGTPSINEYRQLRNQLEAAAARLGGPNTDLGAVYATVASHMRKALKDSVAPPGIKSAWEASDQLWTDMHALTEESTWKHFRAANSRFGFRNKVAAKQSRSVEVILQDTLGDPKLSPEIVTTLADTAAKAGATPAFKNAVEGYLRRMYELGTSVPTTGPLQGIEVVNFGQIAKNMGLGAETSTRWQATAEMIRRSGGDPDEVKAFLSDAQLVFPDGLPNPSKTAQRRTALSGLASSVRLATGIGAVSSSSRGGGAVKGGLLGALAGLIGLMGVGEMMFNPAVMKKMNKVMTGNISEQGAWRTLFGVASSVGMTRTFQNFLQDADIDPTIDARTIARERRAGEARRAARTTFDQLDGLTPFSQDPLLVTPRDETNPNALPPRETISPLP